MNKITVYGRLTRDVEIKEYGDNKIAIFSIACDGRVKDKVSFFDAKAFNKKAEVIGRFFKKGSKIVAYGSMEQNSFTKDDGVKITKWELVIDDFDFCDSPKTNTNNNKTEQAVEEAVDEADLPF